ncbi:MAG: hypothetical protein QXN35_03510 [Ignisphaera sp.]|uniref:Late embryogenesis abundant protein LEA-2 subgroup domain-containing protein n=1 Tax=Ignisphaera aggregans TaxID=334771 RepID=A0A7J3JSR6_9CREN
MFIILRYTLMLVAVFSLIVVLLPLIEFVSGVLENPACFKIDVVEQRPVDYESIEVRIYISYCSNVPLKEVRICIGDREILFGSIIRGEHVKEVAISRKELEKGLKKIEFSIAGLYRLRFSALASIYTGFCHCFISFPRISLGFSSGLKTFKDAP